MNKLISYLTVKDANDAVGFYQAVFNAKLIGETIYLDKDKKVVGHATLEIKDTTVFLSEKPKHLINYCENIHFVLEMENEEELNNTYHKLVIDGTIIHELKEMPWCQLSGFVKDKYGISWSLYFGHK